MSAASTDAGYRSPNNARDEASRELLTRASLEPDPERARQLRDEVVLLNLDVATSIAARFRNKGVDQDDLGQVASMGLVKAVRGYYPDGGRSFLAYAVPTISGELKRHFRDHCWGIRPSRRVQETQQAITRAEPELSQRLGRSPTVAELGEHLGADQDQVIEALAADGCFRLASLEGPAAEDGSAGVLDRLGARDHGFDEVEDHSTLAPLLAGLSERERSVIVWRFYDGWTQREIGRELGVSQMQVSRLLAGLLARLRGQLDLDRDPSLEERQAG